MATYKNGEVRVEAGRWRNPRGSGIGKGRDDVLTSEFVFDLLSDVYGIGCIALQLGNGQCIGVF